MKFFCNQFVFEYFAVIRVFDCFKHSTTFENTYLLSFDFTVLTFFALHIFRFY